MEDQPVISMDFTEFSNMMAELGIKLCQAILDGESKDTTLEVGKLLDESSYYLNEWFQHCSRHRLLIPQAWMVIFTSTNACFLLIAENWRLALPPEEDEYLLKLDPNFKLRLTELMTSLKSETMNVELLSLLTKDNLTIGDILQ